MDERPRVARLGGERMNDRYQYGVRLGKPLGELVKAGEVLGPYTYYEASAVAVHYTNWGATVVEWTDDQEQEDA